MSDDSRVTARAGYTLRSRAMGFQNEGARMKDLEDKEWTSDLLGEIANEGVPNAYCKMLGEEMGRWILLFLSIFFLRLRFGDEGGNAEEWWVCCGRYAG